MAETRKIVKIFLASPGDLQDERRTAKSVVDAFNNVWADHFGHHVELVGWEDTVSGYGRPQAIINRDLEQCEYFIGLIWKRWGTPPAKKGPYSSGFEEEFERSVSNRKTRGSPEISLFFKDISDDFLRDPGPDLKMVLEFKDKIITERAIYFEKFGNMEEFREKVERCIARHIQKLVSDENRKRINERRSRLAVNGSAEDQTETTSKSDLPFSVEGADFLRRLISKSERDPEHERISPADVARFRLLASIVWNQENDRQFLGVHDANILFAHRSMFELSSREQMGLIDTGLAHYSSENIPIWYWLREVDVVNQKCWLPIASLFGATEKRIGALAAMRLVSESLPIEAPFDRKFCMRSWFSESAESGLKVAALNYLAECGTTEDLPAIKTEYDRGDYSTTRAAVDAILHISLRDSRNSAILALFELQPESISPRLLSCVFDKSASIDTTVLSPGIGHRSSDVRSKVAKLLRERGALDVETAEKLTSDSNADVRYEALMSLMESGRHFSDDEANKILVKPAMRPGGLFNPFPATDSAGTSLWEQFRKYRLEELTDADLEEATKKGWVLERTAHFMLIERQFSKLGDKLRTNVDDHFQADFAKELEKLGDKYGSDSDLVQKLQGLGEHLRKGLTRSGLDIVCKNGDPGDLSLVRRVLESGFSGYSNCDIQYLQKFGEWQDIPLIIAALDQPEVGRTESFLLGSDTGKYRNAARAISKLARSRYEELLSLPIPGPVLPYLIVESSDKVSRTLSDDAIGKLFRSEHDAVRKSAALKCIRALPKARLARLLENYLANEKRYYNVIHWLDFGLSLPRDRARSAAEKVIMKEWLE